MSKIEKVKPYVRDQFTLDAKEVSDRTALTCLDESRAVQSQKADADINVIVARFGIGATMPQSPVLPSYDDFTGITDYQSALNAVKAAEAAFMELPSSTREVFENSPQALLEAVEGNNRAVLEKAGLLAPLSPPPNPAEKPA